MKFVLSYQKNIFSHKSIILSLMVLICLATSLPAQAAYYYVDKNSNAASDSNSGTENSPWKTIQKAANVAVAGDTVYVKSGIYYEWVNVKNSGKSGSPIVFKAYPGDKPIIDGTGVTLTSAYHALFYSGGNSYITVDGFEVRNTYANCIRLSKGDHLTVRNCITHDNDTGGKSVDGILIDHCNTGLIEYNESYSTGHNAIDAQSTNNVTIRYNYVHDNPKHCGINVLPVTSESQVDYSGNNIQYNIITGCTNGIYTRRQTNNEISNNLLYKNGVDGYGTGIYMEIIDSSKVYANTKIYNNTIVDNVSYGIIVEDTYNLSIYNNIIAYNRVALSFKSGSTSGHKIDNNLYSPSSNFRWNSSSSMSLSSWKSACKQDASSFEGDPNFADRSSNDYSLTSNSINAIDMGIDLSSSGIYDDLIGTSRPQGSGFDIGAYEFTNLKSQVLYAPTNLRIL